MSVIYKAVKSIDADGKTCYGIGMMKFYQDVFESESEAEMFAYLCNINKLSDSHFEDTIDDYLNK